MKTEDFANGNLKAEILMWLFHAGIAFMAALTVYYSEFVAFSPAVFFVVLMLQRINDQLTIISWGRD